MQGQAFCWCWAGCTLLANSMQCDKADAQGQPK